jgi:hypothetical protein
MRLILSTANKSQVKMLLNKTVKLYYNGLEYRRPLTFTETEMIMNPGMVESSRVFSPIGFPRPVSGGLGDMYNTEQPYVVPCTLWNETPTLLVKLDANNFINVSSMEYMALQKAYPYLVILGLISEFLDMFYICEEDPKSLDWVDIQKNASTFFHSTDFSDLLNNSVRIPTASRPLLYEQIQKAINSIDQPGEAAFASIVDEECVRSWLADAEK